MEKPLRTFKVGSRAIEVTAVFDTYWRFAYERQELFHRRVAGEPEPWTKDPIIAAHRFTNVYRASDRVSQYLIKHVIYEGDDDPSEVFFRMVLFKIFNRIDTWERLRTAVGDVSWRGYDFRLYNTTLDALMHRGQRVYSAAYIMPCPALKEARKHGNHLRLIEMMMRSDLPARVMSAKSLAEVFQLLRAYPSLGDFLAFQLAIDLNYSELVDFSEMSFVVAGPGARDGIRKCFSATAGLPAEDLIKYMADHASEHFQRLGLRFRDLWGRPLQLIDCQNVFCEVDKYARVAHPELAGESGRTRIKQKFHPNPAPLPQSYPRKWKIHPPVTTPLGNNERQQTSLPF